MIGETDLSYEHQRVVRASKPQHPMDIVTKKVRPNIENIPTKKQSQLRFAEVKRKFLAFRTRQSNAEVKMMGASQQHAAVGN